MSPRTIRGWSTDIQLRRGRDGIRIPESGLAVRTCRLDSASELAGSAVSDGDGAIGDLTGITTTHFITTAGTTPEAELSITGTIFTVVGLGGVEFITVLGPVPGRLTETVRQLEDTPHLAAKAACARARSATSSMAGRRGAFHPAEEPAWAAERMVEGPMAAAVDDWDCVGSLVV